MKRTTALIAGVCLAALPQLSSAGTWTTELQIKEINDQPSSGVGAGFVFVETTLTSNPGTCSYGSGLYFAVSDDRRKRLFSSLLAAHLAGRSVKIFFSTNTSDCHFWGYALLDGVVVK